MKEVRNYVYFARQPLEGADLFWSQVRLKHRYRNELVALELGRREHYTATMARYAPTVENLMAMDAATREVKDEAVAALKKSKSASRSCKGDPALADTVKWLKEHLAVISAHLKADKKVMRENEAISSALSAHTECEASRKRRSERDRRSKVAALTNAGGAITPDLASPLFTGPMQGPLCGECCACRQKALRAASGLHHGCYCETEDGARDFGSGPPPRFKSFPGEGYVSSQIAGGMTVDELLAGEDKRLSMRLVGQKGRNRLAEVTLSLGGKGRLVMPALYHRDIPASAVIKFAHVHAKRVGTTMRWEVRFAIESDEGFGGTPRAKSGAVGIDLGWRLLPCGSVRVAYAVGDDGEEFELLIPEGGPGLPGHARWRHADQIRGTHDRCFDAQRDRLCAWLRSPECPAPDWLRERLSHLHQWRSARKLAAVLRPRWRDGVREPGWADARFEGDEAEFEALREWSTRRHAHYTDWEAHQRQNVRNWRDDLVRKWAYGLARKYRTAYLEDTNWSTWARLPRVESGDYVVERARYLNRVAAPGRARQLIREGFAASALVPAAHTTAVCNACGMPDRFDAAARIRHTCPECGAEWDQDANAARNILAFGSRQEATAKVVKPAGTSRRRGKAAKV